MEGVAISMNLILPLAMLANGLNSGNISLFKLSAVQLMMGGKTLPYLSANNTVPESKSSGWNPSQHAKESCARGPFTFSPSGERAERGRRRSCQRIQAQIPAPHTAQMTPKGGPWSRLLPKFLFRQWSFDSLLSFSLAPFLFQGTGTPNNGWQGRRTGTLRLYPSQSAFAFADAGVVF